MYSKFLVLSKFCKHFNIKQFGLIRLSNRRNFAKNSSDVVIPEAKNKILLTKSSTNFQISRKMSSNHNNKGENENKDNVRKDNLKLKQKQKRKFFRRRYKMKILKAAQEKLNLFNKQKELNMNEKFLTEINESKVEMTKSVNKPNFLPPQYPPKQVHVEFMESKNLKDFDLNRSSFYQPYDSLNINKSVIDIKIKPVLFNSRDNQNKLKLSGGEKETNPKSMDSKGNLIKITDNEPKEVIKSDQNTSFNSMNISKETQKDVSNYIINDRNTEYKIPTKSKKFSSENNISKLNNILPKKSENIRILYQAHPKRKTKIRIPKRIQSKKIKGLKSKEDQHPNTEYENITKASTFSSEIKSSPDENISNLNNILPKRSENIRILYQAHPKRKTKIRIRNPLQSNKIKRLESITNQQSFRKSINESDEPFKRHGILYPTEPGEFLNFKIKSINYRSNITEPFVAIKKGILYPTEKISSMEEVKITNKNKLLPNIDAESLKVPMKKVESKMNIEIRPDLSKEIFLPNNSKCILKSTIKQKDKITEKPNNTKRKNINKFILSTRANKNKINFNSLSFGIKNKKPTLTSQSNKKNISSKWSTDSVQTKKLNLSVKPNRYNIGSKSSTTSVENKFNEHEISDKFKNDSNNINRFSTGLKSTSIASDLKHKGAGTIKTNKLTKFKRSRRSNSRGGGSEGDGGDKNKSKTTTKARSSRFWRTLSVTILPLIFGLTIYTMSNIEFVNMFKRMRDGHFGEDPLNMKILPAFYGKRLKSEQADLNNNKKENDGANDNINDDDDIDDPEFDEV
ncbi:uncharacterized protein ACRADG_002349 isoform 2-T2 [Cochliomyia hominivorax]